MRPPAGPPGCAGGIPFARHRALPSVLDSALLRAGHQSFLCYPTDLYQGDLEGALVYWREGGRLLDYSEMPKGAEAQAWRLRPKVDRTAVLTDEQIKGSNDLVAHRVWVNWVRRCITSGKEYVVPLEEATEAFPKTGPPS